MTTFSYAYGPELGPEIRGRQIMREFQAKINDLDSKTKAVVERMLDRKYSKDILTRALWERDRQRAFSLAIQGQAQAPGIINHLASGLPIYPNPFSGLLR